VTVFLEEQAQQHASIKRDCLYYTELGILNNIIFRQTIEPRQPMNTLLPQAFLDSISDKMPAALNIDDFIAACHRPLRFSIRINTLKIGCDDFIKLMTPQGWTFTQIPWCNEGYWVDIREQQNSAGKLPEHLIGLFYIQEASSMLPPVALFDALNDQQHFEKVLDLAAAPGSKTTQLAGLMENCGLLLANEYSSSRIKALHSNLARLGITNTLISHFDGSVHGDYLENQFDAILIDAPCSGEGTVRKDPDAFKNWSLDHLSDITKVQQNLLVSAFKALKPGGQLVYSTCALNFEENQQVCQHLLDTFASRISTVNLANLFPDAQRATTEQGYLHIWPQIFDSEGFFIAKFIKHGSTNDSNQPDFRSKFPYQAVTSKDAKAYLETLASQLDVDRIKPNNLYQRDQQVWFFPQHSAQLVEQMRFVRHGIKLLELKPKQSLISHEALCAFGRVELTLDRQQLCQYLMGRDIAIDNPSKRKGEVVLGYQGVPVGLGKWVGNKIKNKLPRALVNDHVALN